MSAEVEEEDEAVGIPEWVVTFGDMMSLLLTFFIMLVSLSEIKDQEKYQALVESVQQQFGYTSTTAAVMPGESKPRNSPVAKLATEVRAKKQHTETGGDKTEAPVGEHSQVRILREGLRTSDGTVIHFAEGSRELAAGHRAALEMLGRKCLGKPQKIDIRGHTSQNPVEAIDKNRTDHWELAYQRCRTTMRFLVDEVGIDPQRFRLSVAGPHEPIHIGTDVNKMRRNPRVEVFMLDEVVDHRLGNPGERSDQITKE